MSITKLVFATNNKHKFNEIKNHVSGALEILNLEDIGFSGDIAETSDTIEGNALQKAWYIYNRFKINCFADDTGLEIDALNGAPGVYSARYAGENPTFEDNMRRVLLEMNGIKKRSARFRTIIALIENGKEVLFEGKIEGIITEKQRGEKGFGYDPVFQPAGFNKTFAEMTLEIKNQISHRALAINKLLEYLNDNYRI